MDISKGWYPAVFINYCLERQLITEEDIAFQILPSQVIPHDTFAAFAQEMLDKYPKHAKFLVNLFIGQLNKKTKKTECGCVTDTFEFACNMMTDHPGMRASSIGDLWFLRDKKQTSLTAGHVPIYRHIIASSYMKLDAMLRATLLPDTRVLAINTDSVKVQGPHASGIGKKDDVAVGEYGYENFASNIFGKKRVPAATRIRYAGAQTSRG